MAKNEVEERYFCAVHKELDIKTKTKIEAQKKFLSKLKISDIMCYKVKVYR